MTPPNSSQPSQPIESDRSLIKDIPYQVSLLPSTYLQHLTRIPNDHKPPHRPIPTLQRIRRKPAGRGLKHALHY